MIMLCTGFAVTILTWVLLYGGNVLCRWWLLRRYYKRFNPVAQSQVVYAPASLDIPRVLFLVIWLTAMSALLEIRAFSEGVMAGVLLLTVLWPFYLRSKAQTRLILLFDRQGVSTYPVRRGLVSEGTFETRLNWVDCFGYSIYRGHVLFALRAGGQIEQAIGDRRQVVEMLHRVGVRKLKAYDHLELREVKVADLNELEQRVDSLVQDIVVGYQAEAAAMGLHLQAQVEHADDSEEQTEPYAFLKMSLWKDEQMVDELDWMIWAQYEKSYEVLHLPEERLYEALDERVLSLLEVQTREGGLKSPPLLQ